MYHFYALSNALLMFSFINVPCFLLFLFAVSRYYTHPTLFPVYISTLTVNKHALKRSTKTGKRGTLHLRGGGIAVKVPGRYHRIY